MLKEFYIIEDSGLGIYEYERGNSAEKIDFQLLSGFIKAIIDFSKEYLVSNVNSLHLEQSLLVISRDQNRYGVGVYDRHDHEVPAKRLNNRILKKFNEQNSKEDLPDYPENSNFNIEKYFRFWGFPVALPRYWFYTLLLGIITGLTQFLLINLFFIDQLRQLFSSGIQSTSGYLFLMFFIGLPVVIVSLFSGQRIKGYLLGMVSPTVLEILIISLVFPEHLQAMFSFSNVVFGLYDLIYAIESFGGFLGGYLSELIFLSSVRNK